MALSGQNTILQIINSTSNVAGFSGSVTVAAGDLVIIHVHAWTPTNAQPSVYWTVTFDGVTLTPDNEVYNGALSIGSAAYSYVATTGGSKTLSVNLGANGRGCLAYGWLITGYDATTPVAGTGINSSYTTNATSLPIPDGLTLGRDGNAVMSSVMMKGGDFTSGASTSGDDANRWDATGTSGTSDLTAAAAAKTTNPAASTTITYSWTTGTRPGGLRTEVNVATSSGASASASGTLPLSGSATGTAPASGQSSGVLPLSGAATGAALVAGQASGVLPLSGAGTAQSLAKAQGQGVLPLGGSATAATVPVGPGAVASGALPLGGAATAVALVAAQANGVLPLGGTATAVAPAKGLASGALPLGGSAIARAPISADAAGTMPLGGSATAQALVTAQASGSLPFAGSATAVAAPVGDIQNWRQFRRAAHWAPHGFVAGWSQINKSAHWGQRRRVAAWGDK